MKQKPFLRASSLPKVEPHGHSFTPVGAQRLKTVVVIVACALGVVVGIGSAELSISLCDARRDSGSSIGLMEIQKLLDQNARETVESLSATAEILPMEKPE